MLFTTSMTILEAIAPLRSDFGVYKVSINFCVLYILYIYLIIEAETTLLHKLIELHNVTELFGVESFS